MTAVLTLLIVVVLSLVVTRVATIALTATGLSREAARFQARSAFSGAGFTTSESEAVVRDPVRRRIIMWLMLAGNAGIVAVVASLVLAAANVSDDINGLLRVGLTLGGIVLIWLVSRMRWVDVRLTQLTAKGLKRWTTLDAADYAALLHVGGEHIVTQVAVDAGSWAAGRDLASLDLRAEGIVVLGIERTGGEYLGVPDGSTEVRLDDVLVLYGRGDAIDRLQHRRADDDGQADHDAAVHDQGRRVADERGRDADTPSAATAPSNRDGPPATV